MPTPIGHCLAATTIRLLGPAPGVRRSWFLFFFIVAVANLPDVDFLPGYLVGNPIAFHWGPTHSLMAVVLVGGLTGLLAGAIGGAYVTMIGLAITAYASHIFMDMMLGGSQSQVGLQVFWPFSRGQFMLPWTVFRMAPAEIQTRPLAVLFSSAMMPVIVRELLVMVPVVTVSWMLARWRVISRESTS